MMPWKGQNGDISGLKSPFSEEFPTLTGARLSLEFEGLSVRETMPQPQAELLEKVPSPPVQPCSGTPRRAATPAEQQQVGRICEEGAGDRVSPFPQKGEAH